MQGDFWNQRNKNASPLKPTEDYKYQQQQQQQRRQIYSNSPVKYHTNNGPGDNLYQQIPPSSNSGQSTSASNYGQRGVGGAYQTKASLALTGELALGKVPNYQQQSEQPYQSQQQMMTGRQNYKDDRAYPPVAMGGSTQPVYTLIQKQQQQLQQKAVSPFDIAQAQSSLRLLKSKMHKTEQAYDPPTNAERNNTYEKDYSSQPSIPSQKGPNNYRKVFKPQIQNDDNEDEQEDNEFVEEKPKNKIIIDKRIPPTGGRQPQQQQQNDEADKLNALKQRRQQFLQQQQQSSSEQQDQQYFNNGGTSKALPPRNLSQQPFQSQNQLSNVQVPLQQVKPQYQTSMQKTLEKQDPQMMYNAQRFNQMQSYEYKHVEGVDDNEDFQFASDVKGKKNNKPPPGIIKRTMETKKQQSIVGKVPKSNGNIEETRNNNYDDGDSGYPREADEKTPIKRNGLNRLNELNRENSNNSNFSSQNGKSNGNNGAASDAKSTSSSAFRGEIDGKKYYNFRNTNSKKQGNLNTEEDQDDDLKTPQSSASLKFKPNLIKTKESKNNPVQQNYGQNLPQQETKQFQEKPQPRPVQQQQQQQQQFDPQAEFQPQGNLIECPEGCGRKFAPEALERHAKICKKVFQQKRKQFDSSKMRQLDEEQDNDDYAPPTKKQNNMNKPNANKKPTANAPKSKWRIQSEQFRQGIKAGNGESTEGYEQIDDRVECEHCGRKFNQQTLDKHQPLCGNRARIAQAAGKQFKKK